MKAVIDARVLFTGIFKEDSAERSLVKAVESGLIRFIYSAATQNELMVMIKNRALEGHRAVTPSEFKQLASLVEDALKFGVVPDSVRVEPEPGGEWLAGDSPLNKYVAAAIAGGADYLVSNEPEIRRLDEKISLPDGRRLRVLGAREFRRILSKAG